MAKFITHRDASRTNWGREVEGDINNRTDDIQLGCLLRIADATEAMAKNFLKLQSDLDWMTRERRRYKNEAERLARSNAALRGVIKRNKKKGQP